MVFTFLLMTSASFFIFYVLLSLHIKHIFLGVFPYDLIINFTIFFFLAGLFGYVSLAMLFSGNIRLDDNKITYTSIFKKKEIAWKDIEMIGVYSTYKNYAEPIELEDAHNFKLMENKMLFFCTEVIDCPDANDKISDNLIFLQYRPELLEVILEKLKMNNHPLTDYFTW